MWAYSLGIRFWEWLIRRAAAWHHGAAGRCSMLVQPWPEITKGRDLIWFHCASLGEYEQILPAIQCWEARQPEHQILISFYSVSGYRIVKPKENTRLVVGFPGDLKPELSQFLSYFKPKLAVFTKAEIWPLCLNLLNQKGIPSMLVAFRPGRSKNLAHWHGRFVLNQMKLLACISCQDEKDRTFLTQLGLQQVFTDGDPRVERTMELQLQPLKWPNHLRWIQNAPLIVLGSVWPADLDLWEPVISNRSDLNWILAPHQINLKLKGRIQKKFPNAQYWTSDSKTAASNIVVLDTVGVLSRLYRLADAAYVGGGFGRGIHSALEPGAAGLSVAFGPRYTHSREALAFLELGVSKLLTNKKDAEVWLQEIENKTFRNRVKAKLQNWFDMHTGTAQKIAKRMEGVLSSRTQV